MPSFNIYCKSRETGRRILFLAFEEVESGIYDGELSEEIEKLVLKNGSVIRPDAVMFSIFDRREPSNPDNHKAYEGGDDNDQIPF